MKANVSGADTTKGGQRPFDSNKLIYRTFTLCFEILGLTRRQYFYKRENPEGLACCCG